MATGGSSQRYRSAWSAVQHTEQPPANTNRAAFDPCLDFLSPAFDPAKALRTPGLQPPNPRVMPLDNVVKCRAILPEELPESRAAWLKTHPLRVRSEARN